MASWLVIDWDQDQFHLLGVQTARRGVRVTSAATWTHLEPFTPSTAERVGKALREFLKSAKMEAAPVIAGIGRDRILLKELRFPQIAAHEEAALVRFQTAKELTEPADHYAIDYVHLRTASGADEQQIATVAARREVVVMLQTLCQAAGLKLHAVTPRLFGVASALEQAVLPDASPLSPDKRNVVLTSGQRWAELCFFRGEQLVQAQALANGPMLASEIKRNLAVFQAQHAVEIDVKGPECLYVFADDPGAMESLQAALPLPIVVLDPLRQDARLTEATKNPGAFAGALGLALVWSKSIRRPINLVSPKKQQAPTSGSRRRVALYGTVAAVGLLFLIGAMVYTLSRKRAELKQLTEEKAKKEQFFKSVAQERANIEAYKEWEQTTIPWLDEIYDLTARFPHEVGFRIKQFGAETSTKKTAKDGFVGHINLYVVSPKGKDKLERQLITSMAQDSHVRASVKDTKANLTGSDVHLKIDVAKQGAGEYDTRLNLPRPPQLATSDAEPADAEGEEP